MRLRAGGNGIGKGDCARETAEEGPRRSTLCLEKDGKSEGLVGDLHAARRRTQLEGRH